MMNPNLIGIVLLALMLIPLVAVIGPQALGALAGAGVMLGVVRLTGAEIIPPRRYSPGGATARIVASSDRSATTDRA